MRLSLVVEQAPNVTYFDILCYNLIFYSRMILIMFLVLLLLAYTVLGFNLASYNSLPHHTNTISTFCCRFFSTRLLIAPAPLATWI